MQALQREEPHARAAVLAVLERLATPRALEAAVPLLSSADPAVAAAAVGAIRPHLSARDPATATRVFSALVAVCLDPARPDSVRLAALEAIGDLGAGSVDPIRQKLQADPNPRLRRAAGAMDGEGAASTVAAARLEAAAEHPGDDAPAIGTLVREAGAQVSLSVLHRLILRLEERERSAATPEIAAAWSVVRAATHRALAERNSRLAVFELRAALERTPPEAIDDLLAAAAAVGDGACLEPLAGMAMRLPSAAARARVAAAFQAIVRRERLTRRHAAVKKAIERWPESGALLG